MKQTEFAKNAPPSPGTGKFVCGAHVDVSFCGTSPYPGLRPYQMGEEMFFFGRDNSVDGMVDILAENRFLAVLGSSGSGKSSLVNCGLIPALRRGVLASTGSAFRVVHFRPGSRPLHSLSRALTRSGLFFHENDVAEISLEEIVESSLRLGGNGLCDVFSQSYRDRDENLLVVVDQFEEIFRYPRHQSSEDNSAENDAWREEGIAFVNLLLNASLQSSQPIFIVISMRSDFIGDCAIFEGLPERINRGQYVVPRMTRTERREAIVGPARIAGATLDNVLVTRLVNDVGDDPDQLCILSHAMHQTFQRWQSYGSEGTISNALYEEIGTMRHALELHAEAAFNALDEGNKSIAAAVFRALTDRVHDARGVRRPQSLTRLSEIVGVPSERILESIEVFRREVQSFLLPPGSQTVESETIIDISHESLMRVWKRLDNWSHQEAVAAQLYQHLSRDAALHRDRKKSLWREPELSQGIKWRKTNRPTQAWASQYGGGFTQATRFLTRSLIRRRIWQVALAVSVFFAFAVAVAVVMTVQRVFLASAELAESQLAVSREVESSIINQQKLAAENARAMALEADQKKRESEQAMKEAMKAKEEMAQFFKDYPWLKDEVATARFRNRELTWLEISTREKVLLEEIHLHGLRSQVIAIGRHLTRLAKKIQALRNVLISLNGHQMTSRRKIDEHRNNIAAARVELVDLRKISDEWQEKLLAHQYLPYPEPYWTINETHAKIASGVDAEAFFVSFAFPTYVLSGAEWFTPGGSGTWGTQPKRLLHSELEARERFENNYSKNKAVAISMSETQLANLEIGEDAHSQKIDDVILQAIAESRLEIEEGNNWYEYKIRPTIEASRFPKESEMFSKNISELDEDHRRTEQTLEKLRRRLRILSKQINAASQDRATAGHRLNQSEAEFLSVKQTVQQQKAALEDLEETEHLEWKTLMNLNRVINTFRENIAQAENISFPSSAPVDLH